MATKQSTIYSTNPKMDTSGISASTSRMGHDMKPLPARKVAGGELYLEAIDEAGSKVNASTSKANMKKAANLVGQGYSVDHAVDIVAREAMGPDDMGC